MRRKTLKADVLTFSWRVMRLIELQFVIPIPEVDGGRGPGYIRFWLDGSAEDAPGSGP